MIYLWVEIDMGDLVSEEEAVQLIKTKLQEVNWTADVYPVSAPTTSSRRYLSTERVWGEFITRKRGGR
jgi:hypothetical protein